MATAEYMRQWRLPTRLARCQTELERHQLRKGEALAVLADRLSIPRRSIYLLAGRGGSYVRNQNDGFKADSSVIEVVSRDTGIPMGQLFEDAATAARKRGENGT